MSVNKALLTLLWAWSQNYLHIDLLLLPGRSKPIFKKENKTKQKQQHPIKPNQIKQTKKIKPKQHTQAKTMKRNQILNLQKKMLRSS